MLIQEEAAEFMEYITAVPRRQERSYPEDEAVLLLCKTCFLQNSLWGGNAHLIRQLTDFIFLVIKYMKSI